ncbi:acetate/propionate family kinase [soil metagenome]
MISSNELILTINGGSSSIKFAVFTRGNLSNRSLSGYIDRIGLSGTTLTITDPETQQASRLPVNVISRSAVVNFLIDWLEKQAIFDRLKVVGHRIVQGMDHQEPESITQELLNELHRFRAYDPDHLPTEIELIERFQKRHPHLLQVACFDTAFHRTMPRVAQLLPIPRRFDRKGIRRYGFHGISYAYLLEELGRVASLEVAQSRIILAHLGNGASLSAVRDGKSLDTSMSFTPTSGLPMGTRSGDLDPGVAWYLMQSEPLTSQQVNHLINHESGLLGVSETSSDMRDLLKQQSVDSRAAEAVDLFCYQTRKWVGAFAAVLNGLDTLVFSGGIGENAPEVRTRICAGLNFLGIALDQQRNEANASVISTDESKVIVRVIPTNEEGMMAQLVSRLLKD